jgi:hypothetical protein
MESHSFDGKILSIDNLQKKLFLKDLFHNVDLAEVTLRKHHTKFCIYLSNSDKYIKEINLKWINLIISEKVINPKVEVDPTFRTKRCYKSDILTLTLEIEKQPISENNSIKDPHFSYDNYYFYKCNPLMQQK